MSHHTRDVLAASLFALLALGCDRPRPPPPHPAPVVAPDVTVQLPPPVDAAVDAVFDAPPDVPLGPAHPLLEALREDFVLAGLDRYQADAVDLRGTAHLSEQRLAYLVVDLATRKLAPDVINFEIDRYGSNTAEVNTDRLRALRPLRGLRGFAALRARLAGLTRELDRVPEVNGECGGEGCPEQRNYPLVQCLDEVIVRAVGLVDRFERLERPPPPPDAGPPSDAIDADVADAAVDAPLDADLTDASANALPDALPDSALSDASLDAPAESPYLPVLRDVAQLFGDAPGRGAYVLPMSCEHKPILAGLDFLRQVVTEARAMPPSPARR